MLYFDYNPKQITEEELENNIKELFTKSTFQYGDVVKLKGEINSPIMCITNIRIAYSEIQYNKLKRCYVNASCTYFNKSKQEFTDKDLSVLCLQKVES